MLSLACNFALQLNETYGRVLGRASRQNVCLAPLIRIFVDSVYVIPLYPFSAQPRRFLQLTSLFHFTAFLRHLFGPFSAISQLYPTLPL